jgi:nucleotide-binding universal stress UspA family protein
MGMRKILVGMDFSQGAMNALDYSINLAENQETEIVLLWVEPSSGEPVNALGQKNEIRREAKLELEALIQDKNNLHPELKISYKLKKGKIYKEFSTLAANGNFDLALIGTHGISGFEEFWVGSNAYKIISYCPCPVISVRTDYSKKNKIKSIVLPIDDTLDTTKKVPMAVELAQHFQSKIYLLEIYQSDLVSLKRKADNYVTETKSYLEEKGVDYELIQCKSNNSSTAIVTYAEKLEADLMVIMTDQNKATSDIIMGRMAQQIINQSSIPVLSVKPFKMEIK